MAIPLTVADQAIADALLSHQLDLFRLEAYARVQALEVLDRLGAQLEQLLNQGNLTEWGKARVQAQLKQAAEVIDRYYTAISDGTAGTLAGATSVQGNVVRQAISVAGVALSSDVAVPSTTYMSRLVSNVLIQGAKSADWWKRQAGDTRFRFAAAVRQGLAAGESQGQIVSRVAGTRTVPGVMQVAKSNARALVHSSVMSVSAAARRDTFQQNRDIIKGIRQVSTFDSHTTEICIAYAGATWDMDYNPIGDTTLPYNGGVPRHWGCRSVEVPITKTFKELGINAPEVKPGQRASMDGPVNAGMTFKQFLERKGAAFQDEVLGPGRAQMFRKGKITLQQLLDMKGNPLSVKQLQRKYG